MKINIEQCSMFVKLNRYYHRKFNYDVTILASFDLKE